MMAYPQSVAAASLGMSTATLSKRWREAARKGRKWPSRSIKSKDQQIYTILKNIPKGTVVSDDDTVRMRRLIKERQDKMEPVMIRVGVNSHNNLSIPVHRQDKMGPVSATTKINKS